MEKEIGNSISISKQKDEAIIKIISPLEQWQAVVLWVWVTLWTVLGIYVVYYLNAAELQEKERIFFYVYLAFWFYFEFHALRSILFKTFGYELLKFTPNKLLYKRSLFGLGRSKHYMIKNITGFDLVAFSRRSFADAYAKSFWTLANQKIEFEYLNGREKAGMHLEERDAKDLRVFLNRELKQRR